MAICAVGEDSVVISQWKPKYNVLFSIPTFFLGNFHEQHPHCVIYIGYISSTFFFFPSSNMVF